MTAVARKFVYGPMGARWARIQTEVTHTSLNSATYKAAWWGYAEKSGSITKIHILLGANTGSPPSYLVAVQGINASGDPDGVDFGGSSPGTLTPVADSVNVVTLASPATVSVGDLIAAVVYPGSTPPDGSNYIRMITDPLLLGDGRSGSYTGTWVFQDLAAGATIALEYSDGDIVNCLTTTKVVHYYFSSDSNPDEMGIKFSPLFGMTVNGIRFSIPYSYMSAASLNVSVLLYDGSDNVVASAVISDKDFVVDSYVNTVRFSPVSLAAGQTYRVTFRPNTTGSSGRMYVNKATFASESAKDSRENFAGFSATYRTDGGAWTDDPTTVLAIGLTVTAIDIPSGPGTTLDYWQQTYSGVPSRNWRSNTPSVGGAAINGTGRYNAYVMRLPRGGSITKVGIRVTTVAGNPPAYKVGLTTVDSVTGLPTQTAYGGSSITTYDFTATGVVWVDLPDPATAVMGDLVAAHVWADEGNLPDSSNYIGVCTTGSTQDQRVGWTRYYTTGATDSYGEGGVKYSDGFVAGSLTTEAGYIQYQLDSAIDEYGTAFSVPFACKCIGMDAVIFSTALGSASATDFVLYDDQDNIVASKTGVDEDTIAGSTLARVIFTSEASLLPEKTYRLTIKPTVSGSTGYASITRSVFDSAESKLAAGLLPTEYLTYRTNEGEWTDNPLGMAAVYPLLSEITIPDNSGEGGGTVVGGEYAYIG